MKLSYKRDMAHNYMIPECGQEVDENDYRIHMLTENRIQGLLPCAVRKRDGKNCFYYDITSRQSLEHIYGRGSIGEAEILALLRGLHRMLREIKKYLLDASMIVLEPQMIYMDIETKEPVFCYLPGYHKDITVSFQELSAYILEHINQTEEQAVLLGYDIYRKAREENYSLEKILKMPGEKAPEQAAAQMPSTNWFSPQIEPPEDLFRTSAGMGDLAGDREYRAAERCAENIDRDSAAAKREKNKKGGGAGNRQENKKGGGTGSRQENKKGGGKTFVIVCLLFAILLFGAAAVLWGMDTVQIAGIIFFLTSVLAYGCIADSRRKKKRIDRSMDEMPYMVKEQPYIDESFPGYEEEIREERIKVKEGKRAEKIKREQRFGNTAALPEQEEQMLTLVSMSVDRQEAIPLTREQYIVGKLKSQADIVLDNNSISRVHAAIVRRDEDYYLYDLNSTNGTFHNGRRLEVNEHVRLKPGDEIAFARNGFYVNGR